MKITAVNQFIFLISISLILQSGCQPLSISIKGDDCKMNGSFDIVKKGLPANWHYYSPETVSNSDFDILSDSTMAKEGKRSLKFQVRKCESIGGVHSPGFFEEFKVIPGETYKVSFWVINNGCKYRVYLGTGMKGKPGPSETVIQTQESTAEWKYSDYYFTIPPTLDNIRFEANILAPGIIWFDDIRIEGVNDKTVLTVYPYRGYEECK